MQALLAALLRTVSQECRTCLLLCTSCSTISHTSEEPVPLSPSEHFEIHSLQIDHAALLELMDVHYANVCCPLHVHLTGHGQHVA